MAEPSNGLPSPEGWAAIAAGIGAGLITLRKVGQKIGIFDEKTDLRGFARELVEAQREENAQHRHGLEVAIERQTQAIERQTLAIERNSSKLDGVMEAVREANEKTRDRIADLVAGMRR